MRIFFIKRIRPCLKSRKNAFRPSAILRNLALASRLPCGTLRSAARGTFSGQSSIAGVGFALYCRLLEDTIKALQEGKSPEEVLHDPTINMKLDAYIPDDFIDNPRYKLEIYRRLGSMKYEEREDFMDEIIDRFGTPPKELVTLWRVAAIRALCRDLVVDAVTARPGSLTIRFNPHSKANPDVIRDLVKEYVPRLTFSLNPVPQLVLRTTGPVSDALTFLEKNLPRLLN